MAMLAAAAIAAGILPQCNMDVGGL